ncbi:MAG TPA: hypothetical protein VKE69_01990 [Planctomycetota bacterium]|nr:hypothetical protein [Planctomycetota bacterium]
MADARKRRSFRRVVAIQLLLLPLELMAVELLYRGWLSLQGEPYSAWRAERDIARLVATFTERVPGTGDALPPGSTEVLHPYAAFEIEAEEQAPAQDAAWYASADGRATYDIVVLGGSVAAGFAIMGADELVQRLQEDPRLAKRPVRVHGQGRGAYKQPQQATSLAYLFAAGCEPDAVINLDGFNEVALAAFNAEYHANPVFPSLPQWGPLASPNRATPEQRALADTSREARASAAALGERVRKWKLHYSAVLGSLALARLRSHQDASVEATLDYMRSLEKHGAEPVTHGPRFDGDFAATIDVAVRAWREGSRSIQGMCAVRRIPYLHVLQPTLHDDGSKPLTPAEVEHGNAPKSWLAAVHAGYPRLRAEGKKLAEEGIRFLDASNAFAGHAEPLYTDACHFGVEGNRILARVIAQGLLDSLAPN